MQLAPLGPDDRMPMPHRHPMDTTASTRPRLGPFAQAAPFGVGRSLRRQGRMF